MKRLKRHPIILVPLGLLAALLAVPFLGSEESAPERKVTGAASKSDKTGFIDYDILPEALKQQMRELLQQDSTNHYGFYYFFEVDDINHRYYLTDDVQKEVVVDLEVSSEAAFSLVEEKLANDQPKGLSVSFDTSFYNHRVRSEEDFVKASVVYILPEYEADFRQLRVGIIKEKMPLVHSDTFKTETTSLQDVTAAPQPVRGIAYFHEVLRKQLQKDLIYYEFYKLEGTVKAAFTVGGKATSPQIIEGFSTREETYEAYRLDGLVVKALNNPKVHWQYARYHDQLVNVRVGMDFQFAFDAQGALTLTLSDLYPASTSW
ncbi:MAG: hypothetical protein RIG62_04800 [Cyclobacteriaceae bacterium]